MDAERFGVLRLLRNPQGVRTPEDLGRIAPLAGEGEQLFRRDLAHESRRHAHHERPRRDIADDDSTRSDECFFADLDARAQDDSASNTAGTSQGYSFELRLAPRHSIVVRRHDARADEDVVFDEAETGDPAVGLDPDPSSDGRILANSAAPADDALRPNRGTFPHVRLVADDRARADARPREHDGVR